MSKFSHSPGIVGYGLKGSDGSSGGQGFSMYFTNLKGDTDQVLLRTRIQNNYILWSTSSPLPNGRIYQQGDLFVDSLGKVFYIDFGVSAVYKFTPTNTNFSMATYFENSGVESDNGLQRYSNTFSDYAIDSVYSESAGDYTLNPTNIYSVQPKNFNRIEYTDIVNNTRNPFTIWIASDTCSNDAIALVRDTVGENTFRLGNLDSNGNARNVNIKFDVDKLIVSKDTGKEFTRITDDGTVITNHEINANSLLTPVFNYSPSTFKYESPSPGSYARIFWDKQDFLTTNDIATLNNIPATLFFYEKISTYKYKTFNFLTTDSSYREMSFHNIDVSGQLDVSSLDSTKIYGAYITFHNQGWMRSSITKHIQPGIIPFLFLQDPCLGYVTTANTGVVDLAGSSYNTSTGFRIDISTNIASDITVSKDKDWINLSITTPNGLINQLVDVSISSTTSPTTETGTIIYHSSAPDVSIIVVRKGLPTSVTLNVEWVPPSTVVDNTGFGSFSGGKTFRLTQSGMPDGTYINLDISVGHHTTANMPSDFVSYSHYIKVYEQDHITLLTGGTFSDTGTLTVDASKFATLLLTNLNNVKFPLYIDIDIFTDPNAAPNAIIVDVGFGTAVPSPGYTGSNIIATYASGDNVTFTYGNKAGNVQEQYIK